MKILFLSNWLPYPPSNGSKLRIYHLLRGLAQQHDVTLLSFADPASARPDLQALEKLCDALHIVPGKEYNPHSWRALAGFFDFKPRHVRDTFSLEMQQQIERMTRSNNFDLVIASQIGPAGYFRSFQGMVAIFEEVEVGGLYGQFTQATSFRLRLRYGLTWAKQRYYLAGLLRHFRACTVVSEQERQFVSRFVPGYQEIYLLPNCVRVADYQLQEKAQRNTLIFTGSFRFRPNYDAIIWFLSEIFPLVQAKEPSLHLTITGDHANLPLPTARNITLAGFVKDVHLLVAQSWVSIVPIQSGGGTRLKILEAMAIGTPVVTTRKGAEGLDAQHDIHLLIADRPMDFAHAILRLTNDDMLRQRLVDNAYRLVCEKYDWDTTMPNFLKLVDTVGRSGKIG
jgi:glycosyltransferase involved in cell wall biosynthesis